MKNKFMIFIFSCSVFIWESSSHGQEAKVLEINKETFVNIVKTFNENSENTKTIINSWVSYFEADVSKPNGECFDEKLEMIEKQNERDEKALNTLIPYLENPPAQETNEERKKRLFIEGYVSELHFKIVELSPLIKELRHEAEEASIERSKAVGVYLSFSGKDEDEHKKEARTNVHAAIDKENSIWLKLNPLIEKESNWLNSYYLTLRETGNELYMLHLQVLEVRKKSTEANAKILETHNIILKGAPNEKEEAKKILPSFIERRNLIRSELYDLNIQERAMIDKYFL